MKIAVIGSRAFNDWTLMSRELAKIHITQEKEPYCIKEIISGGAEGADTLAERFAKTFEIPLKVFKADWNDMTEPCKIKVNKIGREYNALAGFKRNTEIINRCDMVVAFWDGKSHGTKDSIEKAKSQNKKILIIKF